VGRHSLIKLDEFVDFSTGQPAAMLEQPFQPVPGTAMGHHERIDVHARRAYRPKQREDSDE
jgi:hypothetical protein